MKKFRLKPEAVPFFKKDLATSILTYDFWETIGIDINALEEVNEPYIVYGHANIKENYSSSSLAGWSEKDGSKFHFTIHFPGVKFMENDKFSNGKTVRTLMDKIQRNIDNFYSDFTIDKN